MKDYRKISPVRRRLGDREETFNNQSRRKYFEQEQREFGPGSSRQRFDTRRWGRRGGFIKNPEYGWRDRKGEVGRHRSDLRFFQHDERGYGEHNWRRDGSDKPNRGFGDHCRDTSGSRAYDSRGEKEEQMTKNGVDVRSDIKKEIVKIKKALNSSGAGESEDHSVVNLGGFSIKRPANDDLEESKPNKKKKKRRSKAGAVAAAEKNESILPMPKPKEIEDDNSLLRKKLQEILDENMKLKVDFQSIKRKWDDADGRIAKLEELARDNDAKIVELEHENVKRAEKLELKSRIISDLEKDNRLAQEKLDKKRKLIRDLDEKILAKDDKFEIINKEMNEKERHLNKLIQVKDELYKSKEVLTKENEEVKKLAKDISNDTDVLVKKLLEKEDLITDLNRQLKELKEKENFGVESSTSESETEKLKKVLIAKETEIRDESVQSYVELEDTVKDLNYQFKEEMHAKKPETTLSEKCDSSVAYDYDSENSDLEIDTV